MITFIEPKILKGFRDFLPEAEIIRRGLTQKIEDAFISFGFVPIDTPAIEYTEILLGKGGGETEKQIYRFKDNGGRDVALRFDLTVPFARYTALHREELVFPFKRYHIGKVWRGENTQRGRYREFTQCDFDIIGSDSPASDFEILLLIKEIFLILGLDVSIHINHRGLFNRFLSHIGQNEKSADILRTVDKISKAGKEETLKNLTELTGEKNAEKILDFTEARGGFSGLLDHITELTGGPSPEADRLTALRNFMIDSSNDTQKGEPFIFNPSITRGLDYYTGVVFETFLNELPDIGSVCSGGRYDNLAGLYSKGGSISGVGSSIGLDRLLAALESLNKLPAAENCFTAIACVEEDKSGQYQKLAGWLRGEGIPCEVFLDHGGSEKQLVKQFMLAEKKGMRYVLIPGKDPLKDKAALRDLKTRKSTEYEIKDIISYLLNNK